MAKHMKNSRQAERKQLNKRKQDIKRNKKNIYNQEKIDNQINTENKKNRKKKSQKSKKIIILIRIISLIVMIVCSYQIINWYFENKKNNDMLNDIVSNYTKSTKQIIIGDDTISVAESKLTDLLEKNNDTVRLAYCKIN